MPSMYDEFYKKAGEWFCDLPSEIRDQVSDFVKFSIYRQYSPHTIRKNITNLKFFCRTMVKMKGEKGFDFSVVNKQDVRFFAEILSSRHLSPSTVNGYLNSVSSFFKFMMDEDHVGKNPVLNRHFIEVEKRLPRPMKSEDLKIFLNHLKDDRDQAMFLIMLRCGLRVGEVAGLCLDRINWESQRIIVFNGKGKQDRVVYFSGDVEQALQKWLKNRKYQGGYCFMSAQKDGRPIVTAAIRRRMSKLIRECGLSGKGYTPHTLRHSFATDLINAGVRLEVIKQLMGHKSFDQTLLYAQLADQTTRQSYDSAVRNIEKKCAIG